MKPAGEPEVPSKRMVASKWANDLHRDMMAATLLDPNLICVRSVATDEPESVIRTNLMNSLVAEYNPKEHMIPDLRGFLPLPTGETVK